MALGNNLKKKKLLPEKDKSNTEKPAEARVEGGTTKSKETEEAKASTATKEQPPKSGPVDRDELDVISQEKYDRRKKLQTRYEEDLRQLADKRLQLIAFTFNGQRFAVEISKSREVVPTPAISEVPHVASYIKGVINVRGYVIVTVDLAEKFFGEMQGHASNYVLLVQHEASKLGLLVPDVPDTLVVEGSSLDSSSDLLTDLTRNDTYIKALIRHQEGTIFLLDVEELIENNKVRILPANHTNAQESA